MTRPARDVDVLVVGAGPTGLLLAADLARRGVGCRVIDRAVDRAAGSRATDVHPRTLDVLDDIGILGAVLARGQPRTSASVAYEGRRRARIGFGEARTAHPFMLGLAQTELEAMLERPAAELGVRVERGSTLTGLADDGHGVVASIDRPGEGPDSARFGWVVGCDGAHSAVRRALGLELRGHTFASPFFLLDARGDLPVAPDEVHLALGPAGVALALPMPDGWVRLFGDLPPGQREIGPDEAVRHVEARVGGAIAETGWCSVFRLHSRLVDRYRRGRVLLAGDAAHLQTPVGAFGMNLGLQDAHALGWRLAAVARGEASDTLLDGYEAERRPVARRFVAEADRQTRLGLVRGRLAQQLAVSALACASRVGPVRRRLVATALETSPALPPVQRVPVEIARAPTAVAQSVRAFAEEDPARSVRELFVTVVALAGAELLAAIGPWPTRMVGVALAAGLVGRMLALYHDQQHGAILAGSPAGRALLAGFGWLVMAPPSVWRANHHYHHRHPSSVDEQGIGAFPVTTVGGYRAMSPFRRAFYRATRHPLTVAAGYVTVFAGSMCLGGFVRDPRRGWPGLAAIAVHAALIGFVAGLAGPGVAFTCVVAPVALGAAAGAYVFYVNHNAPGCAVAGSDAEPGDLHRAALTGASVLRLPEPLRWLSANIGLHPAHHLNPRIPFYRLPDAIAATPELALCPTTTLRPRDVAAAFALKLWDPALGRLVGWPDAGADPDRGPPAADRPTRTCP